MSITPLPPGLWQRRIRAQQIVIELTNRFDRVLQSLIIVQPTSNLGNTLPTHTQLSSASPRIAHCQHQDGMALATFTFRAATLMTNNSFQQRAAQQLASDRQLFNQLLASTKGAFANHPHE